MDQSVQEGEYMSTQRSNVGALIGGSLLIGFGVLALLGQLFRQFDFWGTFWPFIIIGVGAMFFVGMFLGGKSVAGLAIPGSIITVSGLMMFLQNLTDRWETWSYGWTVTLFSVGLGIFIMGWWQGSTSARKSGMEVMKIGAILFVIFGVFFEMLFAPSGLRSYAFPALMILLGIYLVIRRSGLLSGRRDETPTQSEPPSQGQ
jgi:hypothetical protein